jgi:glutathione S-transferase
VSATDAIRHVDLETARVARGVRIVSASVLPSPWSEAAKGLFRLAGVPALVVRYARGDEATGAWMRAPNVPVVLHDDELPRASWSEIVSLAGRLDPSGALLPDEPGARARTMGLLHELAGEDGLGWNSRLVMIDLGLRTEGREGFPLRVSQYLAPRYGHRPGTGERAPERVRSGLALFARALAESGGPYLAGARPGALDVYLAAFLTPLSPLTEADCPGILPPLLHAFTTLQAHLGDAVPAELAALRRTMLDRHLGWPIAL